MTTYDPRIDSQSIKINELRKLAVREETIDALANGRSFVVHDRDGPWMLLRPAKPDERFGEWSFIDWKSLGRAGPRRFTEAVWDLYRNEGPVGMVAGDEVAGVFDRLPENRTPDFTAYLEVVRLWEEPKGPDIGETVQVNVGYGFFAEDGSVDRLIEFQDVETQRRLESRRDKVKIGDYRPPEEEPPPAYDASNPMAPFKPKA